jgi:chitinase
LVLDEWRYRDQTYNVDLSLGGVHQLEVRYFERGGDAKVRFSWGRIADPPTPVPLPDVNYSQVTYNVVENAQVATIAVVLNRAYDRLVSVDYATGDGTALAGSDYAPQAGRLTFDPGVTSRTFAVGILDDTEDEANETVALVLSSPSNATLGATSRATLVILDNDEPPLPMPYVQFSDATYSVDEGLGIAMIPVQLSRAYDLEVIVSYETAGGTADVGSDYTSAQGTLVFEPGETDQAIIVYILDDQQDEEEETIVLRIMGAKNALLGDRVQTTLVIVDNDTIVSPWPPTGNVP